MKKFGIIFIIIAIAVTGVEAQDTLWTATYGHPGDGDLGYCGDITSDGGFIIGGGSVAFESSDFWLVRCDSNGDTVWTRNYGGARWQMAYSVIQTSDGGFAATGDNNIASGNDDLYILRIDPNGDTLWTRSFGVAGNHDKGREIIQTSDGGFLAIGQGRNNSNSSSDLYMVKTDSLGNLEWSKLYGYGGRSEFGYGAVQTADGGYAVTGTYIVSSTADVWLLRTDSNGDTLWTRTFDFHSNIDRGDDIVLADDGGFVIAGRTRIGSYYQLLVMKTDSLGTLLWNNEFGGADTDFAESIDKTSDGGYVICGGGNGYPWNYYVVRINSNGDSLWTAYYDYDGNFSSDSDDSFEVRVYPNGDIMVFGYADVQSGSGADNEYWAVKLSDGAASPVGRCCYNNNLDCADNTETECTALSGEWDEALNCTDDPCLITCEYVSGDVNGSDSYNGLDITFGVAFFKGGADPMCPFGSCPIPPCDAFFYCGDVNSSCSYNGLDITYGVAYFKGGADPIPCADCPSAGQ